MRALILALLLSYLFPLQDMSLGATYYVDATNGNDDNIGLSLGNAWKTIAKVNSRTFYSGDSVLFKRGKVWNEQLIIPSSGKAGAPITFAAYGTGEKPVINGGNVISRWTQYNGNIWQLKLTMKPKQVFFDEVKGVRKSSIDNIESSYEWYQESNTVYIYSTFDPHIAYAHPGVVTSRRRACIMSDEKNYIVLENIECKYSNNNGLFFYKSNNNIIRNVVVSFCHQNGIEFACDCSENLVENCITHHNGNLNSHGESLGGGIVAHTGANNNIISNCTSYSNAEDGFVLGGNSAATWVGINNIVEDCNAYDNYESGIDIKNGPQIIRRNIFHNNTGVNGEGHGILISFDADSMAINNNDVYFNAKDGIKFLARGNSHVLYNNRIHSNRDNGIDIEGLSGGGHSITIRYNLIYANSNNGLIFYDTDSHHSYVYNNVIWANGGSYQLLFSAANARAKNNILGGGRTAIGFRQQAVNKVDSNNNILIGTCMWDYGYYNFASYKAISDQDINSLSTAPFFVDTFHGDFHLLPNSPAIEAGVDLGYSEDFTENPVAVDGDNNGIPEVDIGAYEYQGETIN